tara:strand:+ start:38 stop:931 length:894 start_codon:yes stop_codon:yes gene_type:complete
MVNYDCKRCGYTTNRKSVFKNHLLRKNVCKTKIEEIARYDLLKSNGFDEEANLYKMSTKSRQIPPNLRQIPPNPAKKNECEYCNKIFTRKDSLKKHLNGRCFQKKETTEYLLKKLLEEKDKIILKILDENKKENAKKDKKINKLMKQLIKLSKNSNNINNSNINSNNKIIINAYGSENMKYITEKVLKKLVNRPGTAIPNLLKMIHFNDKYPENKNLKVTNIHDPYIKVHNGDNWNLQNKGDIIEDIITTKREILDGAVVDENNDTIYQDKLDRLDEKIEDKNNNYVEKSIKGILLN